MKILRRLFVIYLVLLHVLLVVMLWKSNFLGIAVKNIPFVGLTIPYSELKPHVINLDWGSPPGRSGGLIAVDLDDDGQRDFLVTKNSYLGAYAFDGTKLWSKEIEIQVTGQAEDSGLPGAHGPGVQAADADGDGATDVLFLTRDNTLHVVRGDTGTEIRRVRPNSPAGAERWEHLVVADFRGLGDRDLLLQATNKEGYRIGRYLAAFAIEDLLSNRDPSPMWTREDFRSPAHSGARVADLDGDGRDEVLGAMILGPDGSLLSEIPVAARKRPHLDSIHVADVRPDIPGLEVIALEESASNRVFLYNHENVIWQTFHSHGPLWRRRLEPQYAVVGEFDPDRPGLEIWCRSRVIEHQTPFLFDSGGRLLADYWMNLATPSHWTVRGVQSITTIDWTGEARQLAAAKEFREAGEVAIFDPLTGRFLEVFNEGARRLYVADVVGDWREELIVLGDEQVRVYTNASANPEPDRRSLWSDKHYHRNKMTYNDYST